MNLRVKGRRVMKVKTRIERETPVVLLGCRPLRHIADKNVKIQPVTSSKNDNLLMCQF